MIQALDIEEFLKLSEQQLTIDVRSEGEYEYGHIPHAINLPLFNNEERKIVGTIYKQQGSRQAILEGLEITGKKMTGLVRTVQPLIKDNRVFVHCWRGGMRSGSIAWLLNLFGYQVYTLKGGYKSYRRLVLGVLQGNNNYLVLSGKTGCGKTALLQILREKGEQVIDLEAIAHHKGSAFGRLGQPPQPSSEHFENLLHRQLALLDTAKPVWVEDESKKIGTVVLNDGFYRTLKQSPTLVIELPLEVRIKRLTAEYACHPVEELQQALDNIKKRLGGLEWKNATGALAEKNFGQVAAIVLHYYDKAYVHSLTLKETRQVETINFNDDNLNNIAGQLIAAKNKYLPV